MTGRLTLALLAAAAVVILPGAAVGGVGNGKIVFGSDGRIYAVDPAGAAETDLGFGQWPTWSPDGARLAFSGGGTHVMDPDGSGRRVLHVGNDYRSVWSPDGTRLAFVTEATSGVGALVVVDVADGQSRAVATGVHLAWPPSWSPDGSQLAYTDVGNRVAVVGSDGSGQRLLAPDGLTVAPAWSPDGTQIALLHAAPNQQPALHVITAGGGPLLRLTQTQSRFTHEPPPAPAWSPDGTRIAFTGTEIIAYVRPGLIVSTAVHVVDAEGTLERRLTRPVAMASAPAPTWSPDGRRILFRNGGIVSFMNPDGTCEARASDRPGSFASWQPLPGAPPAALLRCADLDVTVSHDRSGVAAGGEETFRVSIENLENAPATGVRVEAGAPERGAFVSVSTDRGGCSLDGGSLSCRIGELPVGQAALVTVVARATSLGVVSSNVRAQANEPDGNQSNNVGRLEVEALPCTLVARDDGERLVGTAAADDICGRRGPDMIYALAGNDTIEAGLGPDRVFPGPGRDVVHLRAGADFADTRDGVRDRVDCGGERDLVLADRFDVIARDCDAVARPQLHRCKTLGTMRSDELTGSSLDNSVCALAGNDEVHTHGGNDAIDAGSGNDTLDGGKGRDLLLGGAGYDTIFARDGQPDRVRCGSEYDLVFADRLDRVAKNCERVVRR